ncbi:MAG: gamma-glutamyl-gamma-aminobutyrate hydrolase family protein [Chloroflexi bacterium]|nr:gamma-glutamyl-gamma-aminobutyrate hydrolase family protein [Chloroflexota bacterium]
MAPSTPSSYPRPVIGIPTQLFQLEPNKVIQGLRTTYAHALKLAGGIPLQIPLELDEESYHSICERLDGLFLGGGPDIDPHFYGETPHKRLGIVDAERDRVEILLARWAVAANKPIFGVCRGHQVMNVAMGGTMYQDVETMMVGADRHDFRGNGYARDFLSHSVQLQADSHVGRITGTQIAVNSLHHQAIRTIGQRVRVVGKSPGGVIEAIEIEGHPFAMGVQWHPEELVADPIMLNLFRRFVEACTQFAAPGRTHSLAISPEQRR